MSLISHRSSLWNALISSLVWVLGACVANEFHPASNSAPIATVYQANKQCAPVFRELTTQAAMNGAGGGAIGGALASAEMQQTPEWAQAKQMYSDCMARYGWIANGSR